MSEKVFKYQKINTLPDGGVQKFKSDPNLIHFGRSQTGIFVNDEEEFDLVVRNAVKLNNRQDVQSNLTRGKALEVLNNSTDLGVSVLKETKESISDLSMCANQIISNALHIPRCLYCPFCAAEYMFEFTLKDHLKKIHLNEIMAIASQNKTVTDVYEVHSCPYCSAIFYHFALIPIHLGQHHEPEVLKDWQRNDENIVALNDKKSECPSVELIACSPGMSDLLKSLDISGCAGKKPNNLEKGGHESPMPKSILKKKTNMAGKIIFSPSSASLRRIGSDVSKRNTSARRELRFDLPPQELNYTLDDPLSRLKEDSTTNKRRWFKIFRKSDQKSVKSRKLSSPKNTNNNNRKSQKMITSTPISFLDIDVVDSKKPSKWRAFFKRNTKVTACTKENLFLPSFYYAADRYMCAICDRKYEENEELLSHVRMRHSRIAGLLRSQYKCGLCGIVFYKNLQLVRHCHYQHTPQKQRV